MKTLVKVCLVMACALQFSTSNAEQIPFDSERWQFDGVEAAVVDHLGRRALRLKGGFAILKDLQLENGVIEYDISTKEERGFAGAAFRFQDELNYEHFYIRPHQSGNPDANQYTPVINGVTGWQLYHGEGYGIPVEYRFDEWMHIRIVFKDSRAEVYIDSETPSLVVTELKREVEAGGVGAHAGNFAPAWFSNFAVSELPDDYVFAEIESTAQPAADGLVSSWLVSNVFDSASLDGIQALGARHTKEQTWTAVEADPGGITNLARAHGLAEKQDTVFARFVVTSETRQVKQLAFGYSDSVAVFANGTLIYRGDNKYMSRDYRYLGTIGLFDKVYLPLEPGVNEVWFAVTEAFGGWGVKAQFDDLEGISIQ